MIAVRIPHRSLTARVTLATVGLVGVISALVLAATLLVLGVHLTGRLDEDLAAAHDRSSRAAAFALDQRPHPLPPGAPPPPITDARGQEVGTLTAHLSARVSVGEVISPEGDRQALPQDLLRSLAALPNGTEPVEVDLPGRGTYRLVKGTVDVGGQSVVVVTGLPTAAVDDTETAVAAWGVGFGAIGCVIAGATATLVVRRQLRPLRDVAATADTVATTELATGEVRLPARVPQALVEPDTEVGRVAAALNTMLGHVESALAARHRGEQQARQLLADVSHELRTPLATVSGYAELGLRLGEPEQALRSLEKVRTEAQVMAAVVEDLLLLARLDLGRGLAAEEVDLSRMVMETVADAQIRSPCHRWQLDLPAEPVVVPGDSVRLRQVLTNLLGNAARHTPAGTVVVTTVRRQDGEVVLRVQDDGPGIPQDLVGEVFERFTRGDSARNRTQSGAGLGLSLARSILRAHGGDIVVEDPAAGGTTFAARLPAGPGDGRRTEGARPGG